MCNPTVFQSLPSSKSSLKLATILTLNLRLLPNTALILIVMTCKVIKSIHQVTMMILNQILMIDSNKRKIRLRHIMIRRITTRMFSVKYKWISLKSKKMVYSLRLTVLLPVPISHVHLAKIKNNKILMRIFWDMAYLIVLNIKTHWLLLSSNKIFL